MIAESRPALMRAKEGKTWGGGGGGRRESRHYHVKDAFISLRDGPILQFKERQL